MVKTVSTASSPDEDNDEYLRNMTDMTQWEKSGKTAAESDNFPLQLHLPDGAAGLVICAQMNPEEDPALAIFHKYRLATLLVDLSSFRNGSLDQIIDRETHTSETKSLDIFLFGSDIEAGSALSTITSSRVKVIALRGRYIRPDTDLPLITHAPVLLVAAGRNRERAEIYQEILKRMDAESRIHIIPRASATFAEPGVMEESAQLAALWFLEKAE